MVVIDPKTQYCRCGYTWKPGTYHKLIMLLRGVYRYQCPRCLTTTEYRLVHHVVKTGTKSIKNRDRVYRNG